MHQLAVALFRTIGVLSRTQVIGSTIGCACPQHPCCDYAAYRRAVYNNI